jgi:hypothetical protein
MKMLDSQQRSLLFFCANRDINIKFQEIITDHLIRGLASLFATKQ